MEYFGAMLFIVALFLIGIGGVLGFIFAWNKMRGILQPGRNFETLGKKHTKEMAMILESLSKLSVGEVELLLLNIFGRPIRILKSTKQNKQVFEMVAYQDVESRTEMGFGDEKKEKNMITG